MGVSGGSLSNGSEWSPLPIRGEKWWSGPWMAEGDFHGLSL